MEECRTFLEIISELIDKGYVLDFSLLENTFQGFQKPSSINTTTNDFLIDKVYRCNDDCNSVQGTTFVFAISSKKHHFKGIVVNALSSVETAVIPPYLNKIKQLVLNIIKCIKYQKNITKSITQKTITK